MFEYLIYFVLTTFLSTLFAIAGLGSAVALVPTLNIFGVSFDIARASGLFVNTITTVTTSFINFKKKLFDKNFVLPLVISSMIFAYVGSFISLQIDQEIVKSIFAFSLFFIASMILFFKPKKISSEIYNKKLLYISGSIGGFFSGFLGIGGGSIIAPILILFGYDAKKIAIGISFVIPFSSFVAFSNYASVIELDYFLLLAVGVGAYIGGVLGNYILHFKVSSKTIKNILAIVLYLLAVEILFI